MAHGYGKCIYCGRVLGDGDGDGGVVGRGRLLCGGGRVVVVMNVIIVMV